MRHRTARGRKTAPRPLHTAAQGLIGEKTGPNAKLSERGASKAAAPDPRYGGGSQNHGNPNTTQQQTVRERSHVLLYVLLCCCTWWMGRWVGEWGAVRAAAVVLLL